jgi:hypothetical protein
MTAKETPEEPKERYAREAKARLALRMGEDIAEEFTSVAASTGLNVQNAAELMAAAYLKGYADGANLKPLRLRAVLSLTPENNLGKDGIDERDEVLQ